MSETPTESQSMKQGAALYDVHLDAIRRQTDRTFAWLILAQWLVAILIAALYSPYAWEGKTRSIHVHLFTALFLGGSISSLPVFLAIRYPGAVLTRNVIAVAQMLWSSVLIHLTGGRIETHFHIFGSLAFLSFYRDWKVLIPATLVTAGDHIIRQFFWPESAFGVVNPGTFRFLEHAVWVLFEDVFLVLSCLQGEDERNRMVAFCTCVRSLARCRCTSTRGDACAGHWLAARKPDANKSLISFTIWSSVVHGLVMAVQALSSPTHIHHLYGDVLALLVVAGVLGFLCPSALSPAVASDA